MNNEQGTAHCILLAYFFTRAILSDDNVMSVGVVCLLDAKRGVNFYDIVERF